MSRPQAPPRVMRIGAVIVAISLIGAGAPHPAAAGPAAGVSDMATYHGDGGRTGWVADETELTPARVGGGGLGLIGTLSVGGGVIAQPLFAADVGLPDGTRHDLVVVATTHDELAAFDAATLAPVWRVSLGTPQSPIDLGCDQVVGEAGISGTPVIVRAGGGGTIYAVAATEPAPLVFTSVLHARDLATGAPAADPLTLAPTAPLPNGAMLGIDNAHQANHAGLAWANGSLYVAIGGRCEGSAGAMSGWLLRIGAPDGPRAFNTVAARRRWRLGGIWMSGAAPAIDTDGGVFVATGNGAYAPGKGMWSQSVLRLDPALSGVADSFTPGDYAALNLADSDLGSGGVLLVPPLPGTPDLAAIMGKGGTLYLLDRHRLGGMTALDAGALARVAIGRPLRGMPAFWGGAAGPTLLVQPQGMPLQAWRIVPGPAPALVLAGTGLGVAPNGGTCPIVSSAGAAPGTAIAWTITRGATLRLVAYDAERLGAPLFTAPLTPWPGGRGHNAFLSPLVANGRVYAPGWGAVSVFGLRAAAAASSTGAMANRPTSAQVP